MRAKVLFLAVSALVFLAFARPLSAGDVKYEKFSDLNGRRIGVVTGAHFDHLVTHVLDMSQIFYFNEIGDMVDALRQGVIDCVVDDEPVLRFFAAKDPSLHILPGLLQKNRYAFALGKNESHLLSSLNRALNRMREDGSLDAVIENAMAGGAAVPAPAGDRLLRMAVYPEAPPFTYLDDGGDIIGVEIDIMRTLCGILGYRLEISAMGFDEMFDALQENEVDVIAACIAVTEDRKRFVSFTMPHYDGGVGAMVLDK